MAPRKRVEKRPDKQLRLRLEQRYSQFIARAWPALDAERTAHGDIAKTYHGCRRELRTAPEAVRHALEEDGTPLQETVRRAIGAMHALAYMCRVLRRKTAPDEVRRASVTSPCRRV